MARLDIFLVNNTSTESTTIHAQWCPPVVYLTAFEQAVKDEKNELTMK